MRRDSDGAQAESALIVTSPSRGLRADARYCSSSCRVMAHRAREKRSQPSRPSPEGKGMVNSR